MLKTVSLIVLLLLTFCLSGAASDFAISVDRVEGQYGPSSLNTGQLITFYIRITNNGVSPFRGITNGFQVYSPDGVTWDTTVGDNNLGTIDSDDFDLVWSVNGVSLTGSGADTIGFGGATWSGVGLPAGFDDTAYSITIGPLLAQDSGKIVCIDSVYYPPTGEWRWAGTEAGGVYIGDRYPAWTGPHCYTIVDAGGGQILLPAPHVIKLETEEGNPPAGQSLEIDVIDPGNPLSFDLTNGPSWLDLSASSGTTPATITASASVAGLTPGEYRSTVTLTAAGAGNSPIDIQVVLNIHPVLSAIPFWGFLAYASDGNQAPPETLIVTATDGVSAIPFSATVDSAWLSIFPSSGTTPETLVVQSDGRNLQVGMAHGDSVVLTPTGGGLASLRQQYRVFINDLVTAVKETGSDNLPIAYVLHQNYPNPFNPTTQIAFDLPTRSRVLLTVYNVLGRQVATLVNESLGAGSWMAEWDGRGAGGAPIASGIYFYRLHTEGFTQTKKMILLK